MGFPRLDQFPWIKEDAGRETVGSEREISETYKKMTQQIRERKEDTGTEGRKKAKKEGTGERTRRRADRPKKAVESYECLSNSLQKRIDTEEEREEDESGDAPPRRHPVRPTQAEKVSDHVRTKRMKDHENTKDREIKAGGSEANIMTGQGKINETGFLIVGKAAKVLAAYNDKDKRGSDAILPPG